MYPINLTLEITKKGFLIHWFGKPYLEWLGEQWEFKYPYEASHIVFNHFNCTYVSNRTFSRLISDALEDVQAIRLFWQVIRQYTDFEL